MRRSGCPRDLEYCGCAGKIENSQVGVFLSWKTDKGHVHLDRELYLPKIWREDKDRRLEAYISEEIEFKTKLELAEPMLSRTFELGAKAMYCHFKTRGDLKYVNL